MYTYSNFNLVFTPNNPIPDCLQGGCGEFDCHGIYTARSRHKGGVNVGMADGSVSFIGNGIDLKIWWAMGSRDGNDSVEGMASL